MSETVLLGLFIAVNGGLTIAQLITLGKIERLLKNVGAADAVEQLRRARQIGV